MSIPKGTLGALLGRNGMGKTTTIRSLIGFNQPRSGKIVFRGQEIQGKPSYRISRLGLGLVPQGRGIFPNLTVKENLLIAARPGNGMGWNLARVYELKIADNVFVLNKGQVVFSGTPKELVANTEVQAQYLGVGN